MSAPAPPQVRPRAGSAAWRHLDPRTHFAGLGQLLALLTRHRQLTWEMTKREIGERYAGQLLGTFWTIGHPLVLMAIYVFIFSYVFVAKTGLEVPRSHTAYLLAGLIPWMMISEALNKGTAVIVNNASLVKQVVFPLEVLPVKTVLAAFVTQGVATVLLVGYLLASGDPLPWTLVLLPGLFILQALLLTGLISALAAVTVFFRDVKEIVIVLSTMGLYLAPIFYQPALLDQAASGLSRVLYLNPFTYLIFCYQDLIFYGEFQHPIAWIVVPVMAACSFYLGFLVFRILKPMFGNAL